MFDMLNGRAKRGHRIFGKKKTTKTLESSIDLEIHQASFREFSNFLAFSIRKLLDGWKSINNIFQIELIVNRRIVEMYTLYKNFTNLKDF